MSYMVENNVIKTEDINFDFAALGGLGTVLFNAMKKFANNIAQIDPETERKDTYEYVLRHSIRTAILMKHKGIKKGDIVMGCSDNHLDACVPIIAALFLGAIPCSMDPALTVLEMKHVLKQIKPKMIFAIPPPLERLMEVCQDLEINPEIVVFGSSDKHAEFESFIQKRPGEDEFEPLFCDDPKETAIIYFSSGTMGLAKACCLNHMYFIRETGLVPSNTSVEYLDLERQSFERSRIKRGWTFVSYSPLYWITGGKILIENTAWGITRVLCKKFDPEQFWHIVEKYGVLMCLLLPFHMSELAKREKPPNINTDSLIKILTGGAALQKRHWKVLQDMIPDVDIVHCYGLTETGGITGFENYNKVHREYYRSNPEYVGYPKKGIWYKVVDPDTNEPLGPNQEGELLIKSKFFTNGFYNQPSDNAFDTDGWFRTGDVVYYTEDFAFYITDRLKELMKYRQLTVYPYVLENELLKHPAVAQAVALGIPHEEDGDRPAAFVVLRENFGNVTAEEIRKFMDDRMQDKAKLRGGVWIVKSIPVTNTGKIDRREIRRLILEWAK